MKQIELTEEHKSKLLEMCKKLNIKVHPESFTEIAKDSLLFEIKEGVNSIHWFEFCIIHLAEKILDNSSGDISTSELGYFSCGPIEEIHPIDYLYEEFKTLENGK